MWLKPAPMDIGGWLGAANLFSTWASFYSRAFEIPAPDCRCHCEVSGAGNAAAAASPRESGDAPGLELALERCLAALGAPSPAAPAPAACDARAAPVCALLAPWAWAGLAALLLLIGFALGVASRGCCEPRARPRQPAGVHLRPGAYAGPAAPLALHAGL